MTLFGSITGPTEAEEATSETNRGAARVEIAKRLALGGGWSIGAAVAYGVFELLHQDPKDAFPLLRSWGPWAFLSIIAVYVVYDLVKMLLNIFQRGVIAMEHTAVALQRVADKDDRQTQELQTLTSYTSQASERAAADIRHLVELRTADTAKINEVLELVRAQPTTAQQAVNMAQVVATSIAAYERMKEREVR
jgi:hypothetical protein